MKKLKIFFISLVLLPFNVIAYSKYIIPGGETLGIEVISDGVMVIGFYEINGKYNYGSPSIKAGDYITKINDEEVKSIDDLTTAVENNISAGYVDITLKRDNTTFISRLNLVKDNEIYKTGLYVKDSITGIGTLSYIDPETKIFGALGHEIAESNTSKIVEVKSGEIFRNYITSIDRSVDGVAGSKNAKFYYETKYGVIMKNTTQGIYGIYNAEFPDKEALEVAQPDEIKLGKATIYTVLKGEDVNEYEINITKINKNTDVKNISFTITDKELLKKTGGVIQGMSGSPIIQNNKIIGTVTHVIVDNPESGYGIFITSMLEEGEK